MDIINFLKLRDIEFTLSKKVNQQKLFGMFFDETNKKLKIDKADGTSASIDITNSISATNEILNADMTLGTTNWEKGSTSTLSVSDGVLTVSNLNATSTLKLNQSGSLNAVAGDKMFFMVSVKANTAMNSFQVFWYDTTFRYAGTALSSPILNTWYIRHGIVTIGSVPGQIAVQGNVTTAGENSFDIKQPIAINLTKIYGAGNEPTDADFYSLISNTGGFFIGTKLLVAGSGTSSSTAAVSRWKDKTWMVLGDSVSIRSNGSKVSYVTDVKDNLGIGTVINYAVSGRSTLDMAKKTDGTPITANDLTDVDLVTVYAPFNDFAGQATLGRWDKDKTYAVDNIVGHKGRFYTACVSNTGAIPSKLNTKDITLSDDGSGKWIVTSNGHSLQNDYAIYFDATYSGSYGDPVDMPSNLTAFTTYYAKDVTENTFKIVATKGGTDYISSGANTGTSPKVHGSPWKLTESATPSTFYYRLKLVIDTILTAKPGVQMAIIGTHMCNNDNDPWNPPYPPAYTANRNGDYLSDFIDAMKEISESYGIPFLDLYRNSKINHYNTDIALDDSAHPSTVGYDSYIAPAITQFLNSI